MDNCSDVIAVTHVPAITGSYLRFFDSVEADIQRIAIPDATITSAIRSTKKDIRKLEPHIAAHLLQQHYGNLSIEVISDDDMRQLVHDTSVKFVLPKDEVTTYIIEQFNIPSERARLESLFLRWNRENIGINVDIIPDRTIDVTEVPDDVVYSLQVELYKANDWWRQTAAVAINTLTGQLLASGHNSYLPSQFSAEIDGDIRSHLNRGSGTDHYNTIHAEQTVIAECAKQGRVLDGSDFYATTFPCPTCAKLLAACGIGRLYYFDGYAMDDGLEILATRGVEIVKIRDTLGVIKAASENLVSIEYPN